MIGEVESVDEVEIISRMTKGIYDRAEYKKVLAWVKEKCRPDFDKNSVEMQKTPAQKEKDWEFTAKMACIIKDNGRTSIPTAISPNPFLIRRSTGTERENRTFSAPKTTLLTQRACCL